MNAITYLEIEGQILGLLKSSGYIDAADNFVVAKFDDISADVTFAKGVEDILKQHGLAVPAKVDAVLALLPALAQLFK